MILINFLGLVAVFFLVLQYHMKLAFFWFVLILIWFIFAYFSGDFDLFFCHLHGNPELSALGSRTTSSNPSTPVQAHSRQPPRGTGFSLVTQRTRAPFARRSCDSVGSTAYRNENVFEKGNQMCLSVHGGRLSVGFLVWHRTTELKQTTGSSISA